MKMKSTSILLLVLTSIIAAVYFLPLPVYFKHVLILTLFYAYMGTAWNFMCGYAGRLSLGHAAFAAIGAYTGLILFQRFSVSPWLGMLAGGVAAVFVMLLIAYPSFRFGLKGPYFTLASIALAEIVMKLLISLRSFTGGSLGMSLPYRNTDLWLYQFDAREPYFIIIALFWLLAVILVSRMERTRYYLSAIREDDDAAAALGISVNKNLILAACISAFMVAIGGTFYTQYFRYIDPYTVAGFSLSLNIALVAIVGGSGTVFGPTIGAAILIPFTELVRLYLGSALPGLHLLIYGVLLIIIIIYLPRGVTSLPGILKERRLKKEQLAESGEGALK